MPNVYDGTHMFIWQVDSVQKGNVDSMIQQAKQLGLTGVIIKFANGSLTGDSVSQKFMADFKRVAPEFKKNGFKVGGWIYQYMTDPQGEAEACFEAIEAGADWIVLDGEVEVKGKENEIAQFGKVFRDKYPHFPIGLSSFAITNYHSYVPFDEYNKFVDFFLPQIYWADMGWEVTNAFNVSADSYKRFGKPILPTGQSYASGTNEEIKQFVQLCKNAGFTHVSWWDWQHANSDQLAGVKNNLILPPVEKTMDKVMVVSGCDAEGLHIRVLPSSNSDIRETLHNGDEIHVVEYVDAEGHGWYKTTHGQFGGYVWSDYVKEVQQQMSEPSVKKSKHFVDVDENDYCIDAVDFLYDAKILFGDGNGHLNPNQPATRKEVATLIYRAIQYMNKEMGK